MDIIIIEKHNSWFFWIEEENYCLIPKMKQILLKNKIIVEQKINISDGEIYIVDLGEIKSKELKWNILN